ADRPELGLDLVGRRLEPLTVHDVELHSHDLAIVEAGERGVDRILADVGDRHLAAFAQQVAHDADADAVGAPGDEGRAAGEVFHSLSSIASTGLPGPECRPSRNSL